MRSIDVPMAIMFVVFLMFFLVLLVYPAWKRTAGNLRALLRPRRKAHGPTVATAPMPAAFTTPRQQLELNDYDIFILRRLALAGDRGLTRRQLQSDLHFPPPLTRRTLAALQERRLVQVLLPLGFGPRFRLSARGRDFAVAQGYLPGLRNG